MDINAAEAVRVRWIMCEHLEFISVVPIQTVLSAEPDEALIVLDDLISLGLRESLRSRQPGESNIVAIDCWNSHGAGAITTHF